MCWDLSIKVAYERMNNITNCGWQGTLSSVYEIENMFIWWTC